MDANALPQLAKLTQLESVWSMSNGVTQAGLELLGKNEKLRELNIEGAPLKDVEARGLAALRLVRVLNVASHQMSEAGVKHLAELTNLTDLSVSPNGVTKFGDASLKHLKGLTKLEALNVNSNQITDAGLAEMAELKSLRSVNFAFTHVTGTGFKNLTLDELRSLDLHNSPISDAGVKEITRFKKLRVLSLRETKITDAGMMELTALKDLRRLAQGATKTSQTTHGELRKALPKLWITYD
jgi:Leucine-rich repeat (LRR) protein